MRVKKRRKEEHSLFRNVIWGDGGEGRERAHIHCFFALATSRLPPTIVVGVQKQKDTKKNGIHQPLQNLTLKHAFGRAM